ncbi:hypothetical protein AB0A70_27670 [Streptomyces morookaense]|uniref:DUF7848 domain-containing protein n=1 Tax=Streptomyces morookaense TaxID=1970 RepID=UPI0033E15855
MNNRHFRFEDWTTIQDPQVSPVYIATCNEDGCGEKFKIEDGEAEASAWVFEHTRRTGHRNFWQEFGHAITVGTPPGAVLAGNLVEEHQRADADRPPNWPPPESARGIATLGKP